MKRSAAEERLLTEVIATHDHAPNVRVAEIVTAAIRHLHEFVSEVGLTRDEWAAGIEFLTATGQMSSDTRQEFILLSDVLGVSSLVEMISFNGAPGVTDNTVLGPFYVPGSPSRARGDTIVMADDGGTPLVVRGQVRDLEGRPLPGARLDVWQTSANGLYAVQDARQPQDNLRGLFTADENGDFEFRTVRPIPYQIPDDGPVGTMIDAVGRHNWRAAHIHVIASAEGYKTLTTHIFDAGSDYLDSDAVFGVRAGLITKFRPAEPGEDAMSCHFDIVLEPAGGL